MDFSDPEQMRKYKREWVAKRKEKIKAELNFDSCFFANRKMISKRIISIRMKKNRKKFGLGAMKELWLN